ncbi:MAG TPA: calcium/sodium antiporter [Leucothrix sp.]|nr:calcium/sodium antiporter [Leucothrix sp.]
MLTFFAAILIGLVLLIWSSDKFVDGAASIAQTMGISPLIVGMLIIGLGTSAPEMLVSGTAALQGNPGLGLGNAIGSNITNITLVLGVTAIFFVLPVQSRLLKKELPLVLASAVLAWVLMIDNYFSFTDAIILLIALAFVLVWMILSAKKEANHHDPLIDDSIEELPEKQPLKNSIIWTVVGLGFLLISSKLLVWGASNIATEMGISDLVIGLTIVAIGTSLPELAATISSARKGEHDLAVGNIVGSNLFNTMAVLAIPGLIHPLTPPEGLLSRDMPIMLGLTVLLIVFSFGCFTKSRYKITHLKGYILFALFLAYEGLIYYQTVAN